MQWSKLRVLVTGGTGFLGHHVVAAVQKHKPAELTAVGSRDYDLTNADEVSRMFKETKPDVVFHLAGYVGGILVNKEKPADFFYRNLMMGTLMIHHAHLNGIKNMVVAGAGCGYPENAAIPLKESDLWNGFPQKESAPYSLAKRMLPIQAQAYYQQYGLNTVTCIPGNIYGEYDNFDLTQSHVIPALVRKFVEAASNNQSQVEVWGDGKPTRDFVYAGDVAMGMIKAAETCKAPDAINLSSGEETSVRDVCRMLQEITGFKGDVIWNTNKPSGQARRKFDTSKAEQLLSFQAETSLKEGLKKTVNWFRDHLDQVRR